MIKLEHTVLPSPEQMQFIIEGMRNPMNSWYKSDSDITRVCEEGGKLILANTLNSFSLGDADKNLMQKLAKAGTDHRKFMRMMPVYVRITAPLYWWKEFDTYKVGTVANSCSTMHKIQEKEFTMDDFSIEHLDDDRRAEVSNVEWLEHLIHHYITSLVIAARKNLNHLPPNIFFIIPFINFTSSIISRVPIQIECS